MLRCPTCQATYPDGTPSCARDGARLVAHAVTAGWDVPAAPAPAAKSVTAGWDAVETPEETPKAKGITAGWDVPEVEIPKERPETPMKSSPVARKTLFGLGVVKPVGSAPIRDELPTEATPAQPEPTPEPEAPPEPVVQTEPIAVVDPVSIADPIAVTEAVADDVPLAETAQASVPVPAPSSASSSYLDAAPPPSRAWIVILGVAMLVAAAIVALALSL